MNNSEKADVFEAIVKKEIEKEKLAYKRGESSLCSRFDKIFLSLGIPCGQIDPTVLALIEKISIKSFNSFLYHMDKYDTRDTKVYPQTNYIQPQQVHKEWLIMGFSSTDNIFANNEHISVDEKTIRGAIVFWLGDDLQFQRVKAIIDEKQINVNSEDLSGAFTLYALRIQYHGELYRGAKEDNRYMISENIISCCKDNNVDLTAVHLGHLPAEVAQECGFFSLT